MERERCVGGESGEKREREGERLDLRRGKHSTRKSRAPLDQESMILDINL